MKQLLVTILALGFITTAHASIDRNAIKSEFFSELCSAKPTAISDAAEVVKAVFFASMDGRYTLEERTQLSTIGSELRAKLVQAARNFGGGIPEVCSQQ